MKSKKMLLILAIALVAVIAMTSLVACNDDNDNNDKNHTLRFVMPDGTPALAGATFLDTSVELKNAEGGINSVSGEIVATTAIQTEMGSGKADALIAPTNAGAALIKKGADYKLVAVAVEGSLYVVGKPDKTANGTSITFDDLKGKRIASIGQNNTPDKVFHYIIDHTEGIAYSDFEIEFVADGPAAKVALTRENNPCDFAIVGEPAATAFGTPNGGGFSARMDLQQKWQDCGFEYNFPQASLFVKSEYANDNVFIENLLTKLNENITWIKANASDVAQFMKDKGSTTTFPAPSIPRCGVTVLRTDSQEVRDLIVDYLELMTGSNEWNMIFRNETVSEDNQQ